MATINYSKELITEIETLSKNLADSIDENQINQRIRWYTRPNAHIARIKRDILGNGKIKSHINESSQILEIGSGIGTSCIILKSLISPQTFVGGGGACTRKLS